MARARNIKPGFFQNDLLAEIEPIGRLLFAGLWTIADRAGKLEDRPKRIKAAVLPYDDCDVNQLLSELARYGFVVRYESEGEQFIQVQNFAKHQNPHCKEPDSIISAPDEHCASTVQESGKNRSSHADSLLLIPDSLNLIPEENPCSHPASEIASNGFAEFWNAYPNKKAKPKAEAAWRKLKLTAQTIADLMTGLERDKACEQWQRDNGQFVPYPASWLNGRRWEDEALSGQAPINGTVPAFAAGAI